MADTGQQLGQIIGTLLQGLTGQNEDVRKARQAELLIQQGVDPSQVFNEDTRNAIARSQQSPLLRAGGEIGLGAIPGVGRIFRPPTALPAVQQPEKFRQAQEKSQREADLAPFRQRKLEAEIKKLEREDKSGGAKTEFQGRIAEAAGDPIATIAVRQLEEDRKARQRLGSSLPPEIRLRAARVSRDITDLEARRNVVLNRLRELQGSDRFSTLTRLDKSGKVNPFGEKMFQQVQEMTAEIADLENNIQATRQKYEEIVSQASVGTGLATGQGVLGATQQAPAPAQTQNVGSPEQVPTSSGTLRKVGSGPQAGSPGAPVRIRVRDKKSGRTGSIPEDEFDPALYDRIE